MLDRNALADEFNLEANDIIDEIRTANDTPTINNPNKYIEDNIIKANKLLDKILAESDAGNFSPRMAEVGSLLINSVNIAYEKILSKKMGESSLQIKRDMLRLKEREQTWREKVGERPINQQNNIIINGDREAVLKLLNSQRLIDNNVVEIKEEENDAGNLE
jgi:hypothetical protein